MTNRLSSLELRILDQARRGEGGVTISSLTLKFGVSIKDLSRATRNLTKFNLIAAKGVSLHLTKAGLSWIQANQEMFAFRGKKTWREVPERFKGSKISPFEPYAPRVSKLSQRYFGIGGD
ncbi:hypothetical protein SAMN04488041_1125 [Sulfitobacter pontiacus]|jgi:hypothetical protein|uniref:Winged helix-turn-helix DNA-binding n=1 Tax=Sulfitobacter pontiacus TaxID=60137 RepID=A0A1H3DQK5_9RHOB|nr:hypothetical protein [Sulfitobacter pontiacus]SDX68812.1 hypothetical protein SAMN04488041_1125 [Sulfitobacter pontiacus]|tara:strand:+ start:1025 stop:1384 length:360 start_codon:yes stop_codon:yes gene_type:complete